MSVATTTSTTDTLLDGRVILRQPADGYRVALDPVLLAAFVRAERGQRVLDVGCGTGAAMFCLAARVPGVDVTGLEIQPDLARLANEGITLNHLSARARVMEGDLAALSDLVCAQPFDLVLTNPPFVADGSAPPASSVATAHRESHVPLAEWILKCLSLLKSNGRLVMIHRADRMSEALAALRSRQCGDIRILPVLPKAGAPARRVLIDAGKGRKSPDTLLAPLVLHQSDGGFTAAADAVLRNMASLNPDVG